MMKKKIAYAFLVMAAFITLLFAAPFAVHAQTLKVATGDPKGTYSRELKELKGVCSTADLQEQNTSGSVENIALLTGNQVNAAIVQTDILSFFSQTQDLSGIKTLIPLHIEAVHVISRNEAYTKGGFMGIGGQSIVYSNLSEMAGHKVGAVGGSVVTAKVIRSLGGVNFEVVEYSSNDKALADLQDGKVDAVIAVGGAPLSVVSALDTHYKLLTIPQNVQDKLSKVYVPTRVSYPKMNAAGVSTIATPAALVSREYKTVKYVTALKALRDCFNEHLDDLKETTGTHPAWQTVKAGDHGKWNYMELK